MYFASSSPWSDPDKNKSSPLSTGRDGVSHPGPSVIIDVDEDSERRKSEKPIYPYLQAMLGDNPPTPGGLFNFGLSSLNMLENKNHLSPSAILTASAEEEELKIPAAPSNSGTYQTSDKHVG